MLEKPRTTQIGVFVQGQGPQIADTLIQDYKVVPEFENDKNYYFDWGAERIFSLAGRGPGECGAGVFDLIEVDRASAEETLNDRRYYTATALTFALNPTSFTLL